MSEGSSSFAVPTSSRRIPRVYLVHRSVDRGVAERIARVLRDRGIDCWFDGWEILGGDNFVFKMADGLKRADGGLVLFSEAGIGEGSWSSEEFAALLRRVVEDKERTPQPFLLPIEAGRCPDMPEFLRTRNPLPASDPGRIADDILRRFGLVDPQAPPLLATPPPEPEVSRGSDSIAVAIEGNSLTSHTTRRAVFISYAHEDELFDSSVEALATSLRSRGYSVMSDHDHKDTVPALGWTAWMQRSIDLADFVLVVCTPTMKAVWQRERELPVRGATVESAFVLALLRKRLNNNLTCFPILPDKGSREDVPVLLQEFFNDHRFPSGFERIARLLDKTACDAESKARSDRPLGDIGSPVHSRSSGRQDAAVSQCYSQTCIDSAKQDVRIVELTRRKLAALQLVRDQVSNPKIVKAAEKKAVADLMRHFEE